ncbi:nuclear transport factor 2 family protein [Microbispora sp. ATCC PTA-5024]|uniref:nuclear transport factor 2 family protein n=1 Tax=Microbispora sp. ATCC PTA-5024 TaxID=316330 RepID=UPI0003DD441E|nr:nuclear transport factor 2 family protein [Microbispora sp. ATCC PTA-5024]ETK36197.1 hypothetical protein MPTA5024_11270 [Microbispora sp. ATCC PTA-5024]
MPDSSELYDEWINALNEHDENRLAACFSPDGVMVTPQCVVEGREQIAWYFQQFFSAFGDFGITVTRRFSCEDGIVAEWRVTGTHTGQLLLPGGTEVSRSDRRISVDGVAAYTMEGGRFVTGRIYYDQMQIYGAIGSRVSRVSQDHRLPYGEGEALRDDLTRRRDTPGF